MTLAVPETYCDATINQVYVPAIAEKATDAQLAKISLELIGPERPLLCFQERHWTCPQPDESSSNLHI
jgi:hypothetical protein